MPVIEVAQELGIHPNTLYKWRRQYIADDEEVFLGHGPSGQWVTQAATQRSTYSIGGIDLAVRVSGLPQPENVGIFYFITDHLGSTTMLAYGNDHPPQLKGKKVPGSEAAYLPYGGYRATPTTEIADRGFTGHRHRDSIGLIYMRARYYVPGVGRFASADTIVPDPADPQSFNRYGYSLNNPLVYRDPSGHRECASSEDVCSPIHKPVPLPNAKYLFVGGSYFDMQHINGGQRTAKQIYDNVQRAVEAGGATFSINRQMGIHGFDFFTYESTYTITDKATEDQLVGISLAIYADFEIGWELFQANMSGGIFPGLRESAFAIEDLPSDYVGFYAATHEDFDASQVLQMIGTIEIAESPPPRSTCIQAVCDRHDLKNIDFINMSRKIESDGRWISVPWPEELTITQINDSDIWYFSGERYCLGSTCS